MSIRGDIQLHKVKSFKETGFSRKRIKNTDTYYREYCIETDQGNLTLGLFSQELKALGLIENDNPYENI